MLNCFTAIGRVAQRTCRKTATGTLVVKFTLAIARDKDKNGEIKTDFINCVIIGNMGNYFERYAETGAMLSIQGAMRTSSYEKEGKRVTVTECLVNSYKIIMPAGTKPQAVMAAQPAPEPPPAPTVPPPVVAPSYPGPDDMLPFDAPEMYY